MKKSILILMILLVAALVTQPVYGAAKRVKVSIPDFPVTLNGLEYDNNDYMIHPLLLYKNITYFPMTYYRSNLMNLNTSWTSTGGLVIAKGNPEIPKESSYEGTGGKYNGKAQTASVVDSKVTVNGKVIDNQKESYPLLQFRDIVYFPLTWRFAVDEFGWSYTFDKASGLNISADNFFYLGAVKTYYLKDDLNIRMVAEHDLTGILPGNLRIIKNGVEKRIGSSSDYFGYYYEKGPIFTIKNNFIYTTHLLSYDDKTPRPCRISIETGEIFIE